MKYVEWVEPYWNVDEDIPWIHRLTVEDAIRVQLKSVKDSHPNFVYKDDNQALEDFLCVRMAYVVGEME